ncbi:MAG TPA: efflux RND transporter periplasmic adaptor subunit [Tepidisphaeraceae bacterium]|nr:efflux RND transporter periplasmic adaptor subunit [Tepidisphaeraceae bacterium]
MRACTLVLLLLATPAFAQQGPQTVVVAPVEKGAAPLTQPLVANVEPVTRTTIATEEAGLIAERRFDEGQQVQKGAVLARGKTDLVQAQRDAAAAAVESAVARLVEARATAENARREVERVRTIYQTNVGTQKELNDAITQEQVATATVAVRNAEIAEKKAEVARLDLLLSKASILSPIDGVIARRYVEVGQWVKQGDPIADVVQLDPLFVRVNIPEGLIARMKIGDPATVTVDALGGESFTGKIEQIIPNPDPASRTFPVKILLPNPEHRIWPGFFARATITSQGTTHGFLVPRDAVTTSGNQHRVMVARGAKAVPVPVKLGPGAGDKVSVTGELTESDLVVIRGNEMLRGGEDLIVQNASPPNPPAATTQTAQGS